MRLRNFVKYFLASALCLLALPGCEEPFGTRTATRVFTPVKSYDEFPGDPAVLSTVRTVAVMPFANQSGDKSFDSTAFAEKFANQMSSQGRTRVIFPREMLDRAAELNRRIAERNQQLSKLNLLGKKPEKEDAEAIEAGLPAATDDKSPQKPLDPVKNRNDAVKLARMLEADLVFIGKVTDFDPYYRPRLSVSLEAITTGYGASAAQELIELTQWGVARNQSAVNGLAWYRQQVFDSRDGGTARDIYLFARNHHTEDRPFDTEVYMRVLDRFYEFVGGTLAEKFVASRAAAVNEAMERARKAAAQEKKNREAILAQVRRLVNPVSMLPPQEMVADKNIFDRRDRTWRADEYRVKHPERMPTTEPEPIDGGRVVTGP